MRHYKKKPVVIQAAQWDGTEAEQFCLEHDIEMGRFRGGLFVIETLEGPLKVFPGDWVIKGIKGEFYPCRPDVFENTYAEVFKSDG